VFSQIALETFGTIATWQFWVVAIGSTIAIAIGGGLSVIALATPRIGGHLGWAAVPVMLLLPNIIVTAGIILLIPAMLLRGGHLGFEYLSVLGLLGFLKVFGAAFLGTLLVAFIPIFGRVNSVLSMAHAAIVVSFSISLITKGAINIWPDIWTALLMAISIAVGGWALMLVLSWPTVLLTRGSETGMQLIGLVLRSAVTYVAAAVYGGWIKVANVS
jgi:hypothetical protein